jgi:adenylate kinase
MTRILFIGPPGVGKGTQATLLADHLGVLHITTGGMLRDEIAAGSPLGLRVSATLRAGHLVDDATMTELLIERLTLEDASNGFLLDGYPRTVAQVEALDAILDTIGTALDLVILLTAPEDVLLHRLSGRALHGRSDDNDATIRERLRIYALETEPIADHYDRRTLLARITGTGDVDTVQDAILRAVQDDAARPVTAR